MFKLSKQFKFEAAHKLPHHDGKCANLHGHSWVGQIVVEGHGLFCNGAKQGMLMDFGDLKKIVEPTVEKLLDHHYLNETIPQLVNPTSEELARFLFELWEPQVKAVCEHVRLKEVTINETCTSECTYSGNA